MAHQEVTDKYTVVTTKTLATGKKIRTKAGVAQRFADGRIHLVLNCLPLNDQLWLEPQDATTESYPDPE